MKFLPESNEVIFAASLPPILTVPLTENAIVAESYFLPLYALSELKVPLSSETLYVFSPSLSFALPDFIEENARLTYSSGFFAEAISTETEENFIESSTNVSFAEKS